jgi:hypothetical protein
MQPDNDMWHDLKNSQLILEKVRESNVYAQHLYAAMCNNEFQQLQVMPILRDQRWSCSWRSAGGIVAELRARGEDYMDYYCSGIIGESKDLSAEEFAMLSLEQQTYHKEMQAFVPEGVVTDDVEEDLRAIGWAVID